MLRIAPTKYLCAVQCNVEDYGLKRGINEKGGQYHFRKTFAIGSDRKKEYCLRCKPSATKNSSITLPRISFTTNENLLFFLVITM